MCKVDSKDFLKESIQYVDPRMFEIIFESIKDNFILFER